MVQYSTRVLTAIPELLMDRGFITKEQSKEWTTSFSAVRRELSLTRRTLRFFRQIQIIDGIIKTIKRYSDNKTRAGSRETNLLYMGLKVVNSALAVLFFTLDHVFWAYLARVHRNQKLVNKVGDISDWIYIAQSLITISTNSMDSHYAQKEYLDPKTSESRRAELDQNIHEFNLESIKNFTDMITAIFFLDNKRFTEPFIGLVGMIGSAVSIYRYWVFYKYKKSKA